MVDDALLFLKECEYILILHHLIYLSHVLYSLTKAGMFYDPLFQELEMVNVLELFVVSLCQLFFVTCDIKCFSHP